MDSVEQDQPMLIRASADDYEEIEVLHQHTGVIEPTDAESSRYALRVTTSEYA